MNLISALLGNQEVSPHNQQQQHADQDTFVHQQPQQEQQPQAENSPRTQQQQPAASGSDGTSDGTTTTQPRSSWRHRLIRGSIAVIQALLLLELAAMVVPPLLGNASQRSSSSNSRGGGGDGDEGQEDLDPADTLMDYLEGRRGLEALQSLDNKQLRQAVDNLVTEDFQELGVKDRGAEIRDIIEGIIRVRERGPRPPPQPERVGLGRVGPLKFKNSRPTVKAADGGQAAPGEGS